MARLIVKSPYIKCGGGSSAGGYMRYIATRERVELIQDDRLPTRKQEQLIVKLVKDFPDAMNLDEYGDYQEHPTKVNASAFISQALEENWSDVQKSDGYMKYIATRPRAERLGTHGLFGDKDGVELDKAMAELENYTGNVWTHIISLRREDAERLGYDNARAWRNLLRAHRNDISAAMNIPPQDFRWYAAFHDEGDHPHVHMMAWSVKPNQAYLSQDGIRQIKSKLTNDIFQQEMLRLYEQKTVSRDQLVREARQAMRELVQQMHNRICDYPEAERLMQELALQLETVKGKKSYGYLPKKQKALVDEIVDHMFYLELVSGLRKGELVALLWSDLDIKDRTISVSKQYIKNPNGELTLSRPKTETSVRKVSIPQMAVDLLIQEHEKHPGNPYMFPSPITGEMYYPDSVVNLHKKILKDAGLEHIRFHDLRHPYVKLTTKNFACA